MLKTNLCIKDFEPQVWNRCLTHTIDLPMMRWEWFYCFETTQPKPALFKPAHIALIEGKETLAIAPMYIKKSAEYEWTLSLIYELIATELGRPIEKRHVGLIPFTPVPGYQILIPPTYENSNDKKEILTRFICEIKNHFEGQKTFLQFQMVATQESEHRKTFLEQGFLQEESFTYQWHNQDFQTFDDFLKSLPYRKRNKIKREMAALANDGIVVAAKAGDDLTAQDLLAFHRAYETNVEKHYTKGGYLTAEFFESLHTHFREFLQINYPIKKDEVLGMALFIKSEKALFGRWWGGFSGVPFLHFNTCYYHPIAQAIAEGKSYIDPGFQGLFKKRRGFDRVEVESFIYSPDPYLQELTRLVLSRFKPSDYY